MCTFYKYVVVLLLLLTCTKICSFFQNIVICFVVKDCLFAVFLKNFISASAILDFSCSFIVKFLLPCSKVPNAELTN
jgi:hypothetical protein